MMNSSVKSTCRLPHQESETQSLVPKVLELEKPEASLSSAQHVLPPHELKCSFVLTENTAQKQSEEKL